MKVFNYLFGDATEGKVLVSRINMVIDELKNCTTALHDLANAVQAIANVTKQNSLQLVELAIQQKYLMDCLVQMEQAHEPVVSKKQIN